ncbi:hypothetical protein ABTE32_21480, partial [Acinetobacter baumannii]
WKDAVRASGRKRRSALARTMKAIRRGTTANQADPDLHLVVVTGTGDKIYTDQSIAPLLTPDDRTHISVLGE